MTPSSAKGMLAVSGSGPDNVYFATQGGFIWRFDGAAFGALPVHQNSVEAADLNGLWVSPTGAVFSGGNRGYLVSCMSSCTSSSGYSQVQASSGTTITDVCGLDDTHVYAVGYNFSNAGVLFAWNGTAWNYTAPISTLSFSNKSCWVAPNGDVFIGAQSKIIRFDGVAATPETIVWPAGWTSAEISWQVFEAIWGSGSRLFATGYRLRVISRDGAGTWTFVYDQPSVGDNYTLYGSGPTDAYAMGQRSATSTMTRFDPSKVPEWQFVPLSYRLDVSAYGLWAASPRLYFVAGTADGSSGVAFRGTR